VRRDERSDTELVLAARGEDPGAFGQLFDRWFDRSWNVARTIVRDDDLAADVAQDALLVAWQQLDQLRDPDAFGGWLLRSTRNRALNRLAREQRSTASGDEIVSGLRDRGQDDPVGAARQPQPDAVSEIRDRQELVWAAAAALGENDTSLLDLHLRHGLGPAEIAEELGLAPNTAHQQLFRLRGRLGDAIGSFLLWRNGRPLCDGLAVAVSGRKAFDRSVARAVRKHQSRCERCAEERASLVDPAKLFAAVPLVVVPAGLKAEAAAALEGAGVPMGSAGGSSSGADHGPDGRTGPESADAGPSASDQGHRDPSDGGARTPDGHPEGGQGVSGPGEPAGGHPAPSAPTGDGSVLGSRTAEFTEAFPSSPDAVALRAAAPRPLSERVLGPPRPTRALALAAAGVIVTVAVIGFAVMALRGDGDDNPVAAIESNPVDLAGSDQEGGDQGGDDQDPAGPTSFSGADPSDGGDDTGQTGSSVAPGTDPTTTAGVGTTNRTTVTTARTTTTRRTTTSTAVSTTSTTLGTASTTRATASTATTTTRPTTTAGDSSSTATGPTTPSSPTTGDTSSTTDPPPPAPVIRSFTASRSSGVRCATPSENGFLAEWSTINATGITLTLPSGSTGVGASGSASFCVPDGQSGTISLVADGPGGQVTRSAAY
jgi:RNA polymerase sigma factor (sigma-70 family)